MGRNWDAGGGLDFIEVEILSWGKYQRKDVKRAAWFAVSNRILEDAKLYGLGDPDWKVLLYLFSQASQQNTNLPKIFYAHADRVCGLSKSKIDSAISRLCHADVTRTSRARHADVTPQDKTVQDNTEQNMVPAPRAVTPVGVYISVYQDKYGHRPEVGPREGKILKTFSDNHPGRWEELIRGYLQMPDSWAVARSHPVEVLVSKVNEIGRFLATGKVATKKVLEQVEEQVDKAQGTNRKRRRPIEELEAERDQQNLVAIGGRGADSA